MSSATPSDVRRLRKSMLYVAGSLYVAVGAAYLGTVGIAMVTAFVAALVATWHLGAVMGGSDIGGSR